VLRRALLAGAAAIRGGETDAARLRTLMGSMVDAAPYARLDYVEVADAETLQPQQVAGPTSRLFGAVRFGQARLIDNVGVDAPAETGGRRGAAGQEHRSAAARDDAR
jgi:pantoate--beta-alanine ligase